MHLKLWDGPVYLINSTVIGKNLNLSKNGQASVAKYKHVFASKMIIMCAHTTDLSFPYLSTCDSLAFYLRCLKIVWAGHHGTNM